MKRIGILIGCASTQVTQLATVGAQTAGPGQFSERVIYSLGNDSDFEDLPANTRSIRGWTPVGGVGGARAGGVVLCR